jgi:putative phosphoesterase
LESCDEIWHAGDFGDLKVIKKLEEFRPLRGVYGNIDGKEIRLEYPRDLRFILEGVDVLMTHIGGYPGRYQSRIKAILEKDPPQLYICGHSHILKIIYDQKYKVLHMNPGACGQVGFHLVKTMIRFSLDEGKIHNVEVIEMGKRGQ